MKRRMKSTKRMERIAKGETVHPPTRKSRISGDQISE